MKFSQTPLLFGLSIYSHNQSYLERAISILIKMPLGFSLEGKAHDCVCQRQVAIQLSANQSFYL
jgi:hypothetical protein